MIRYRYAQHVSPPAPFIHVAVRCPSTAQEAVNLPAQIDTGADRTVLPTALIASVGLVEDGRLTFQGFAGDIVELPIFLVEVRMHDLPSVRLRAVGGPSEPHILLGRDLLNLHRLRLDGRQLALEIED